MNRRHWQQEQRKYCARKLEVYRPMEASSERMQARLLATPSAKAHAPMMATRSDELRPANGSDELAGFPIDASSRDTHCLRSATPWVKAHALVIATRSEESRPASGSEASPGYWILPAVAEYVESRCAGAASHDPEYEFALLFEKVQPGATGGERFQAATFTALGLFERLTTATDALSVGVLFAEDRPTSIVELNASVGTDGEGAAAAVTFAAAVFESSNAPSLPTTEMTTAAAQPSAKWVLTARMMTRTAFTMALKTARTMPWP